MLFRSPLEDAVYDAIKKGEIVEGRIKKKNEELKSKLLSLGISNDEAKQYREIYKSNVFLDKTRGEVHMVEVIELILDAFEQVMDAGPMAREPCMKLKVSLVDTRLHEDAIHRGPAQVYPAIRDALHAGINNSAVMYEPIQVYLLEAPTEFMSSLTKLISGKRGQLLDVKQEAINVSIKAKLPVGEMIGWSSELRSATEGRGVSSLMDQKFEPMPKELQIEQIKKIRSRKGLKENQ